MGNFRLFITLMLLLISAVASAKSTWIEVIGINDDRSEIFDNFEFFYQEAASFRKVCASSKLKPQCFLFLNSDWSLAGDAAKKIAKLGLPKSQSPSKAAVLGLFENQIQTAQSGDTLILTLTSHGHMTKTANSCIIINSRESICETDLTPILKAKPPGVRVVINAEGCFSGGFADLSSSEICPVVRADRRNASIPAGGFFWQQIEQGNMKTLKDFTGPMGPQYRQSPILASNEIKSLMCRKAREQAFRSWPRDLSLDEAMEQDRPWEDAARAQMKILTPEKNTTFFSAQSLEVSSERETNLFLNSQIAGFAIFLREARPFFKCQSVGLTGELCQSLEKIMSPQFEKEIQSLETLSLNFLKSEGATLKDLQQKYQVTLKTLLSGPYGEAWKQIEPCLFNVEQTVSKSELQYRQENGSRRHPLFPRNFTEQDLHQAESCEASIEF